MINQKLNDYKKDSKIQQSVENLLCSIYETKTNEAKDVALKVAKTKQKFNTDGY